MGRPEQNESGRFDGGLFSGAGNSNLQGNNSYYYRRSMNYNNNGQAAGSGRNNNPRQYMGNRTHYANGWGDARGCQPVCRGCPNRGCAGCPDNNKSDNTVLIIAVLTAAVVLLITFFATILCLVSIVFMYSKQADKAVYTSADKQYQYEAKPNQNEQPENSTGSQTIPFEDSIGKTAPKEEAGAAGEYYGEIRDSVRTDLEYGIEWENYEYEGNNDKIMIAVDYPVIKGDVPNLDIINDVIAGETEYFIEYYNEYSKYMLPEEAFGVYAEGYVTYMDEEVMSVVFSETIYTDYWVDSGLYCVNIDIANGIVLNNSSILQMDDEFAIDFRNRSKEQNGEVSALNYMTDQEIAYYLSTAGTSILFYTPLGMEVGLNYGENYVTVTYKDYKNFLQKY